MRVLLLSCALCLSLNMSWASEPISVPGTGVKMIPPTGFKLSERFPGFIMTEYGASIVITELPAPYAAISKGFTPEVLERSGMTLLSKEPIQLHTKKGVLFQIKQAGASAQVHFFKWIGVVGDEAHTAVITASYPAAKKEFLEHALKHAVVTAEWQPAKNTSPYAGLNYQIDNHPSLKLAKKIGNSLMYTKDGQLSEKPTKDPLFIISASYTEGLDISDKKVFSKKRLLSTHQVKEPKIELVKDINIGGLKGIEIIGSGIDPTLGHAVTVYQVTLFGQKDYFIGQGFTAQTDQPKFIPVFKQVMRSFKPKSVVK